MNEATRISKIEEVLVETKSPSYRRDQILQGIYRKYAKKYSEMKIIPGELRNALEKALGNEILSLKNVYETKDTQVDKVLFETRDKHRIEAVSMTFAPNEERDEDHESLCISSQSGCAQACTFCATGAVGFKKNLTADEITDQIIYFLQQGKEVDSVSFMGMGEPFANPNLFEALKIITDKDKMAFSQRRVSVSTIGIIPGIKRFQKEFKEMNLAFSLHSPFAKQRTELMPITRAYPISDVMKTLKDYIAETNKKVFISYVLLGGINDTPEHAHELVKLIKNQGEKAYLHHVNLIRFNPGSTLINYQKPASDNVYAFRKILDNSGIKNTLKQRFGSKINAACGQLYGKYKKVEKRKAI